MIDDFIHEALARYADAVEEMCERSLTDPRGWGVLVERGEPTLVITADTYRLNANWSVRLDPSVPYGNIHVREST